MAASSSLQSIVSAGDKGIQMAPSNKPEDEMPLDIVYSKLLGKLEVIVLIFSSTSVDTVMMV